MRRGFSRHAVLARLRATWVGKGSVSGELFDLGHYCGARASAGPAARVEGEVYRLPNPDRALGVLDEIEGFRPASLSTSLFLHATTEVALTNGESLTAWITWLNRSPHPLRKIESGDYVNTSHG